MYHSDRGARNWRRGGRCWGGRGALAPPLGICWLCQWLMDVTLLCWSFFNLFFSTVQILPLPSIIHVGLGKCRTVAIFLRLTCHGTINPTRCSIHNSIFVIFAFRDCRRSCGSRSGLMHFGWPKSQCCLSSLWFWDTSMCWPEICNSWSCRLICIFARTLRGLLLFLSLSLLVTWYASLFHLLICVILYAVIEMRISGVSFPPKEIKESWRLQH